MTFLFHIIHAQLIRISTFKAKTAANSMASPVTVIHLSLEGKHTPITEQWFSTWGLGPARGVAR